MQRIPIADNVFCHTHKQFQLSHVTVAESDSSDSSQLYPNERYRAERYALVSIFTIFFSAPLKKFSLQKRKKTLVQQGDLLEKRNFIRSVSNTYRHSHSSLFG